MAVGAAGLVLLALAGPAATAVVVGRGIAGVVLGMSQKAVRWRLGPPVRVVHASNEFGSYTEFRYAGYVVDFQGGSTVTSIATTLPRERAPGGVGVGSTWSQLRARVPHVLCDGSAELGDCHVGRLLPGRTVTDFVVRRGKVTRVVVGVVLD